MCNYWSILWARNKVMCGMLSEIFERTHFFNLTDDCQCPIRGSGKTIEHHLKGHIYDANLGLPSAHKLAVLVPYRDRFEELIEFAPYLHNFLNKQEVSHHIYILNQVHILWLLFCYCKQCNYILCELIHLYP